MKERKITFTKFLQGMDAKLNKMTLIRLNLQDFVLHLQKLYYRYIPLEIDWRGLQHGLLHRAVGALEATKWQPLSRSITKNNNKNSTYLVPPLASFSMETFAITWPQCRSTGGFSWGFLLVWIKKNMPKKKKKSNHHHCNKMN